MSKSELSVIAERRGGVASGDDRGVVAFDALFRAHFDDAYRMVARLLGPGASRFDIEEVTQRVFIAARRSLPKFSGESKITTWLYAIASRVALTELRSWRRQRRLKKALLAVPPASPDPATCEATVSDRQHPYRVWRCLMSISPKKRIVYVLYEVERMSVSEIAEVLTIPEATVWTRLFHARRELLVGLDKLDREEMQ